MSKTYFLSTTDLREDLPVHGNIDDIFLKPAIWQAQTIQIQSFLGSQLYDEIAGQIDAGTVTALNTTLLTLINPALGYYAMSETIRPATFQTTNRGVGTKDGQNFTSASLQEIANLETHYKNRAQWYSQRLINYLIANVTDYPLYDASATDCYDILPKKNSFTSSIYIPPISNCNEYP